VVCVLLGLFIYGGWYYATQSGGTGIKLIDQVPEYIKKATGVGQTAENGAPATELPPEPTRTEAQAAPAPVQPAVPATPPAAQSVPEPAASPPAPAAPAPAVALDSSGAATPAPPPPPAVVATPSGNAPAAVPSGATPASTPTSSAPPPAPAPAADGSAATAPVVAPAMSGETSQEASATAQPAPVPPAAKVVIRANRDAWIEIRDKDDAVLLQRVLRQGESFNVPDQKGLLMTTGNAGGIVIELEGKPLQSLGSLGVVKRGIKLDPAALADGSAFNTDDTQ
jgi:cytoskeleton protein RodZ